MGKDLKIDVEAAKATAKDKEMKKQAMKKEFEDLKKQMEQV